MYRDIPVYKAEADAGLSEAIKAKENCAIGAYCPIMANEKISPDVILETRVNESDLLQRASAFNQDQFDLHYIYTILATTGWNRNDDVFDKYEMWSARSTAEDKPFNKSHDPNNIIGHITGNSVVDENYELVNSNTEIDLLPDKFHILTSAVIYKHVSSRDQELTEATKNLIQEISSGKWFVSMEALFSNFDYAITGSDGIESVVSRNEESAFLSKHLLSYGGTGEYNGYRVGRLMRNLTFSGKGLVENPGNPESIIFKEEDSLTFKGVANNLTPSVNLLVTSSSKGESSMSDNNEQVRTLEAQVSKLEARLRDMDEEKVQARNSAFEKACADKDAEITELQSKLEAAIEGSDALHKSVEGLEAAKAEGDNKIAELVEKLDTIEAASLRTSRVSSLVDKGVNKADAEALVDTFTGISDEQFEALVETQSKLIEANKPSAEAEETAEAPHQEDEKKKKKKNEEEEAKAEEAVEAAEEAVDAEALEDAETEKVAALAAHSENESDSVLASLNTYFSEILGGNNTKKES
tara:strand:+ start:151 stop:1728 length:1578 start_codon:yes stop_codon:yes gene_type:complete